ncbi:MAG: hypothetical protein JWM98_1956 [Thermoleophilia bacterium]|nr:hypothetical protein [Thermoleophilia bacterium]
MSDLASPQASAALAATPSGVRGGGRADAGTASRTVAAFGAFGVLQLMLTLLPRMTGHVTAFRIVGTVALLASALLALAALWLLGRRARRWPALRVAGGVALCGLGAGVTTATLPLASDMFLIGAAALAGTLMARAVDRLSVAAGACALISVVDLMSVYAPHGSTGEVMAASGTMSRVLTIGLALPGKPFDSALTVGFADLAFAAFLALVASRFALPAHRTAIALSIGFALPLALALLVPQLVVAALPAIAGGWLWAHRREVAATARFRVALAASLTPLALSDHPG